MSTPEFDLLQKLQNVCVKIPLFQDVKDIPIYAKNVRKLYIRKLKDPPPIHVIGRLSDLMIGKTIPPKYGHPGDLVVTSFFNNVSIHNTLVDQGEAFNIMTNEILDSLRLTSRETPTILELEDRSPIRPQGIIEDIIISIYPWEYQTFFYVLQLRFPTSGHPLILV